MYGLIAMRTIIVIVTMIAACAYARSAISNSFDTSNIRHRNKFFGYTVFYQAKKSEKTLPLCKKGSVCNTVDTYEEPWLEKQCRCPGEKKCSMSIEPSDGHTISDQSRHYKMCEPIKKLRKCRYFKDVTWTIKLFPDKTKQQIINCVCPKNTVAYILKTHSYQTPDGVISQYSYACSPKTDIKCEWKEPCKMFTVTKRSTVDSVKYYTLCNCASGYKCPERHTDRGVIFNMLYNSADSTRMYNGYCIKSW